MKYLSDLKASIRRENILEFVTSPGVLVTTALWIICLIILPIDNFYEEIYITVLGLIIPFGILFYWYSINLMIPQSYKNKYAFLAYMGRASLAVVLSMIPMVLIILLLTDGDGQIAPVLLNIPAHLFLTVPISWKVYKRKMKGKEEIQHLKQELGQTSANIDFLRSQINPHFLFNALNTLYGTAIQEKAERTSEGIEMLGDMMRFMLQENLKEKIPLEREVEYLKNYIRLQKLRTESSDTVKIQTDIQEQIDNLQIAPMLLIPFVENAFKHGLSFREPSPINITLEVENRMLYFDVYNNKHPKKENDPELNESGIGLENVQQRLQLQYPDSHNLMIRETTKEFFVHLTIQLDQ